MSSKVAKAVTDKVLDMLEQGLVPWERPWDASVGMPTNAVSGKVYRGSNLFMLSWHAMEHNCESNLFATPKQVNDLGGFIKRGAKVAWVHFWKQWTKPHDDANCKLDDDGNCICEDQRFWVIKAYKVLNLSQCSGLERYVAPNTNNGRLPRNNGKPIDKAEMIANGYQGAPVVIHGGNRACYTPSLDKVNMPKQETFKTMEEYYSTLFHELTHSTGHPTRLNRKGIATCTTFGSPEYSREELVAEMGAAMLSTFCNIEHATLNNSAAYIQGWLKALKKDTKAVLVAGAQAHKAMEHILGTGAE